MMIKRILESGWQSGSHEMRWQELQLCEVAICPGFEEEGWQEERNENDLRRWSGRIFWSFFCCCSYNLIWKMRETILTRICSNFYNNKKVIKMRLRRRRRKRRRRIEMIILIKSLLNFLCVCVCVCLLGTRPQYEGALYSDEGQIMMYLSTKTQIQ